MKFVVILLFLISFGGLTTFFLLPLFADKIIPKLENTWWGPGVESSNIDKSIRPFKITFSDEDIDDLKSRLQKTRNLTPPLEGTGWTYGISGTFLKNNVLDYWLNKYDFQARIKYLNKYQQFVTNVQGLDIHFIHVKPKNPGTKKILPLLLTHGWPGSVREFYDILPMLTTPHKNLDFVFEVIAPSLPGYGFSSGAVRRGLGSPQIAVVLKNLMLRLGFDKFYVQGGDWGAIITAQMASLFPEHVIGAHSNMCGVSSPKIMIKTFLYSFYPSLLLPEEDQHLMFPLKDHFIAKLSETGYLHIQATKPDTIGVGFADSPSALASYILEKFSTATNRGYKLRDDGGLFEKYTPDVLIDNLMMYWIPNSMTTAMRIYAESFSQKNWDSLSWPLEVPSACAQFPHEIMWYPPEFLKEKYRNLIQVTRMPRGGHFAALEEPELLSDDIWKFVSTVEELRISKNTQKTDL